MTHRLLKRCVFAATLVLASLMSVGQRQSRAQEPRIGGGDIALNPDDVPMFPDPPYGFNIMREGIPHGKLQVIEYDSKSVGTVRRMQVYTPPGYSKDRRYPVLYLMHGIGGEETEWERYVHLNVVLDNLLVERKVVPMIVVMPNGRARKDDAPTGNIYAASPAFAAFEADLFGSVIPTIDARYGTYPDKEHRALAGLSMGGGQALNFGLTHLDMFDWIGAFSPAPNTKRPDQLVPDPEAVKKLKLLWLSSGNKDGLIRINQGVHAYLKRNGVPHVWTISNHAHDPAEWSQAFYYFAQKVFADAPPATPQ